MEKVWDSGRRMSRSIGRGMGMETWGVDEAFLQGSGGGGSRRGSRGGRAHDDDEEALRWAAIERLPTYSRMRTAILSGAEAAAVQAQADAGSKPQQYKEVDVRKLAVGERQEFIERVFRVAEQAVELLSAPRLVLLLAPLLALVLLLAPLRPPLLCVVVLVERERGENREELSGAVEQRP